jgi:predicted ATP-grasp superfamily ATP-dependent carboligase
MAKVFDFKALEKELEEAASQNLEVMIQEFIPGNDCDNYSYWGFRYKDSFYAEATAQKVRNDPPGTGSPRVQVTKNIPELIPLSRKILNELNYQGYANVEFKKDTRTSEYKFMEINPRINRCMQQAIAGGIDYPWIIFNQLKNGVLPINLDCKEGIYWIDLAKDMIRNFQFRNIEKYNLKQYLYPYFHSHVFAVLSFRDIKPFIKRSIGFISK